MSFAPFFDASPCVSFEIVTVVMVVGVNFLGQEKKNTN